MSNGARKPRHLWRTEYTLCSAAMRHRAVGVRLMQKERERERDVTEHSNVQQQRALVLNHKTEAHTCDVTTHFLPSSSDYVLTTRGVWSVFSPEVEKKLKC